MNKDINKMKSDIEQGLAWACYQRELTSKLERREYKCTCSDPYTWTDEEIIEYWNTHEIR